MKLKESFKKLFSEEVDVNDQINGFNDLMIGVLTQSKILKN